MYLVNNILLFHRRLFFPALISAVSLAVINMAFSGQLTLHFVGLYYIITAALTHFIIYEKRHPEEYYYYYNTGLNKTHLWISTAVISLIFFIVFLIIMVLI